jgi:hypothetical protein
MDPPPLPFQLQDPARLRKEFGAAGLKAIDVETITETLEFATGQHLWNWLVWSNPICEAVLGSLNLTAEERRAIEQRLDQMVRERANGHTVAKLTNPINVGVGMK